MKQPNCQRCRYFYVTWDPERPYGCRAMQFKSKVLPAVEVFEADGTMCLSFQVRGLPSDSEVLAESKITSGFNLDISV
jgi:hypothetical protein